MVMNSLFAGILSLLSRELRNLLVVVGGVGFGGGGGGVGWKSC